MDLRRILALLVSRMRWEICKTEICVMSVVFEEHLEVLDTA